MNKERADINRLRDFTLQQRIKDSDAPYLSKDPCFYFNLILGFKVYCSYEWDGVIGAYCLNDFKLMYRDHIINIFTPTCDMDNAKDLTSFKIGVRKRVVDYFDLNPKDDLFLNLLKIENQYTAIDITDRHGDISQDDIVRYYSSVHYTSRYAVKNILQYFSTEERENYFHDSIFDCRSNRYLDAVFDTFQQVGCLQIKDKSKLYIHESMIFENIFFVLRNQDI